MSKGKEIIQIPGVNPLSREGNSQTGHRMPVRALGLSSMAYVSSLFSFNHFSFLSFFFQ